ncbi:hypothetical protein [Rhabdothermincola sp.]|uniref:hypothetical protein n=1 Tax=Rhabdothermincola sp. TaxID=2820405 RepID=UPI002FDF8C01
MYLRIDPVTGELSLEEPDDFSRFHLEVPGNRSPEEVAALLQRLDVGRAVEGDPDRMWISVDAVQHLSAGAVGEDWLSGFEGMLAYARSKGFLDGPGTHVRAHVVRAAPS